MKTALARSDADAAFRNVLGWVDLGGILFGTALAGWFLTHPVHRLLARLLCWYRGYPFDVLKDLDRHAGGPLDGPIPLPAHLAIVHLVAFPLAHHLSSATARHSYRRLAPLGPSDGGGVLLGDLTRLPGWIYPIWGADHYLRTDWDVCALVAQILAYLREVVVVQAIGGRVMEETP